MHDRVCVCMGRFSGRQPTWRFREEAARAHFISWPCLAGHAGTATARGLGNRPLSSNRLQHVVLCCALDGNWAWASRVCRARALDLATSAALASQDVPLSLPPFNGHAHMPIATSSGRYIEARRHAVPRRLCTRPVSHAPGHDCLHMSDGETDAQV